MLHRGLLTWNVTEIAHALKISESDVKEYFTDGRRVSFIVERRLAKEVLRGQVADSEGEGYDVLDCEGRKWEVRCISRHGVYFCPSYMVGSGRTFNEPGFLNKLESIEGYVLADIEEFPNVRYWILPQDQVRQWWNKRKLGSATKISRQRALELITEWLQSVILGEVVK